MDKITGGCLCGAVRFIASGSPDRVGVCHCRDCRKHHGSVFYAAAIYPASAVQITGETRAFADRHFCPVCGSSVFARASKEIELHLGAMDDPNLLAPEYELWTARRAPWLPEFAGTRYFWQDRDAE